MESQQTIDRFWAKVQRSEGCWEWQASKNGKGYGYFKLHGKVETSNRTAFLFTHGSIPEGLHVLHTCHNPGCCNPAHLYAGTNAQNQRDKAEAGRGRQQELSAATVAAIKTELAKGRYQKTIALEFNTNARTVNKINLGEYHGTTQENR